MYEKRIFLGWSETGKEIRKRIKAETKADLRKEESRVRKEWEELQASKDQVGEYAKNWIKNYKGDKSKNTITMYENAARCLTPITNKKIKDVTQTDLQMILTSLPPRRAQIFAIMVKQVFNAAVADRLISSSPAESIKAQRVKAKERRNLTEEEVYNITSFCADSKQDDMSRAMLLILYYTGCRPGELAALTWNDIQPEGITINKAVAWDHNQPEVKCTKTGIERIVPIPGIIFEELRELRGMYDQVAYMMDGKIMSKCSFTRWARRVGSYIGEGWSPYIMRHDFATRLYYMGGMSLKAKARIMGHSEKMLIEIYSHLKEEQEDYSALLAAK